MKPILYVHGGSGNHGCEAIARTLNNCLDSLGIKGLTLTANIEEDKISGLVNNTQLLQLNNTINKYSIPFLTAYLRFRLTGNPIFLDMLPRKSQLEKLVGYDTAIAIGGDTYSYGYSDSNTYMHELFRKKGMRTILWGCSIEPALLNDSRVLADLNNFDLITARESVTYDALRDSGINCVKLFPDMAFSLPCEPSRQDHLIENGNTIGLNFSPMILNYHDNKDLVFANIRCLIEYILRETNHKIALIPHVVWPTSDDRMILSSFYEEYKDTGRMILIEDCNCMQLKSIISKMRMFVCARTHASIAAYSTCVPTLVLGYSVKARGIAKDIWGEDGKLVVPVQNLKNDADLLSHYKEMESNYTPLKMHLETVMPHYISTLSEAEKTLMAL